MHPKATHKALLILVLCGFYGLSSLPPFTLTPPPAFALTAEEQKKKEEEEEKKKKEEEAKKKIKAFEEALRSGDQTKIHAAARRLESDPVAVRHLRRSGSSVQRSYRSTVRTSKYKAAKEQAARERAVREAEQRKVAEVRARAERLEQEQAAKERAAALKREQAERERAVKEEAALAKREQAEKEQSAKEQAAREAENRRVSEAKAEADRRSEHRRAAEVKAREENRKQQEAAQEADRRKAEEARRTAAEEKKRQAIVRSNAAAVAANQAAQAAASRAPAAPPLSKTTVKTPVSAVPPRTAAAPAARLDTAPEIRAPASTGELSSSASPSFNTSGGGTGVVDARSPVSGPKTRVLKPGEVAPVRPVTGHVVNQPPPSGGAGAGSARVNINDIMREARMAQPVVTPESSGIKMKGRQPLPETPPVKKFKGETATWTEINKRVSASAATQTDGPTTWVDDEATAGLAKMANPKANVQVRPKPSLQPSSPKPPSPPPSGVPAKSADLGGELARLRSDQAEQLKKVKNAFDAEARRVAGNPDGTINTDSPEYRKLHDQYNQTRRHIQSRQLAKDPRGADLDTMKTGGARNTGSRPRNIDADVDVTLDSQAALNKQRKAWEAAGDDVKVIRDSRGKIRSVTNRTRDIKAWSPSETTPRGRRAQLEADLRDPDSFPGPGAQRATGGSKDLPRDPEGAVLANKRKFQTAEKSGDLKGMAKSTRKAAEQAGIANRDPSLRRQMGQLDDYDDTIQAGRTHLGQDPKAARGAVDKMKGQMRDVIDQADEAARAKSALIQKSRRALAENLAKGGHTDVAGRISGRADWVDETNAQVRDVLAGGKVKTGNQPLTSGKSSFAPSAKDVKAQINTMADDLTKLSPAYQQQRLDEIRASQGDDFADKLTKQMKVRNKAPRSLKDFTGKAASAAMTGVAATGLTAEEISRIGSEKLKSGEDLTAMDAARTVGTGLQAIPHIGLSKVVAEGTYNTTSSKTRQVLIDRDKGKQDRMIERRGLQRQIANAKDPAQRAALEKQLGKMTEQHAALDRQADADAGRELGGYFDSNPANVVMRTIQGKDTFVGDTAGKVAGAAKTIVVDMPAENWNRNVEEARARAKAEGRDGLSAGEYAGVLGNTAFDTVSDMGPKQAAEGIHTILSGWEADRAEQGARDSLRGSLSNKFSRHSTALGRIRRDIEALDPNDPLAQQKKQDLLRDYNDHYGKMQGMGDLAGKHLGDPAHRLGVLDSQMAALRGDPDKPEDLAAFNEKMQDPDFRKAWFDAVEARGTLQGQVESGGNLTEEERKFLDNVRNSRNRAIDPKSLEGYADMFVPKGDAGTQQRVGETAGDDTGEGPSLPRQDGQQDGQSEGEAAVAVDGDTLPEEPEKIEDPAWLWDEDAPGGEPDTSTGTGDSSVTEGDDTSGGDGGDYASPSLTGNRVLDAAIGAGPVPTDGQETMEEIMGGLIALAGDGDSGEASGQPSPRNRADDLRNAENGGGGSSQAGSDADISIASNTNVSGDIVDQRIRSAQTWSSNAQATSGITAEERGDAAVAENNTKMDDIQTYGDETADSIARISTAHETAKQGQDILNKQKGEIGNAVFTAVQKSVDAFTTSFGNDIGRNLADSVTDKVVTRLDPTAGDTAPPDGQTVAPPPISDPQITKPPPKKVKKNTRKTRKGGKKGSKGGKKGSKGTKWGPVITVKHQTGSKPSCSHKPGGCPGKKRGQVCYCGCGKRR